MRLAPDSRRRYGRQVRLAEIGEPGQARLCSATANLASSGLARTIAEKYVRAAGMKVAPDNGTIEEEERRPGLGLRHPAARDVADGALDALLAIRQALGLAPEREPRS